MILLQTSLFTCLSPIIGEYIDNALGAIEGGDTFKLMIHGYC